MIYWRDDVATFKAKLAGALDVPSRLGSGLRARRARARGTTEGRVKRPLARRWRYFS